MSQINKIYWPGSKEYHMRVFANNLETNKLSNRFKLSTPHLSVVTCQLLIIELTLFLAEVTFTADSIGPTVNIPGSATVVIIRDASCDKGSSATCGQQFYRKADSVG